MSIAPDNRDDALAHITALMDTYDLKLGDIKQALKDKKSDTKGKGKDTALSRTESIMRLFVYIGGAFIFAGLGVFVSMFWGNMGSASRVVITLGPGIAAFIMGVMFAKNVRLEKAATPAFIIAFLLQPTGLFVLLREYGSGDNASLAAMIVFGILAVQQLVMFLSLKRTSLLFGTVMFCLGFLGGCVEFFDVHRAFASLVIGTGFFFVSVDLHKREFYKDLTPLFYILSTGLFYGGLYYYTGNTLFDPANLAIAMAMLFIAVLQNSRTLYALSILCIVSYASHGPGGGWLYWGEWYSEWAALVSGTSVILAGLWLRGASFTAATPLWFFFGMGMALGGAFHIVYDTPLEVLFIGFATAAVYASLILKSRAALAVATVSLISYISYFSDKHFGDVIAWPVLLIMVGFMILGAGLVFLKLSRKIADSR